MIGYNEFDQQENTYQQARNLLRQKRDFKVKLYHEKIDGFSHISIEGYANQSDIYHVWKIIIPVLKVILKKDYLYQSRFFIRSFQCKLAKQPIR